jgi:SAM-dependent methyltransferase
MHHSDFIASLASVYKPNIYVELGVWRGETLSKVQPHIRKGFGVDMNKNDYLENLKNNINLEIIYSTTDDFFEKFNNGIDMAFIDADHSYLSVLSDFKNILKILNPGGIIFLHDTDPENNDLMAPGYCGDSYKIVKYLETCQDINCITLPLTEAGLTMVTKKNDTRTFRRGVEN